MFINCITNLQLLSHDLYIEGSTGGKGQVRGGARKMSKEARREDYRDFLGDFIVVACKYIKIAILFGGTPPII